MPKRKRPIALILSAALLMITLILWPVSFVYPKGFSTKSPPDTYGVVSAAGEFGFIHVNYTRPKLSQSQVWQFSTFGIIYATDYIILDATTGGTRTALKIRWRTIVAFLLCTTAFFAWRFFRARRPQPPGFDVQLTAPSPPSTHPPPQNPSATKLGLDRSNGCRSEPSPLRENPVNI